MPPLDRQPWPRACVHVYTGDGKGKTTAALGLALRAAGRGLPTWIGQFMKGVPYGELAAAEALADWVTLEQLGSTACLPWSEVPPAEEVALARRGLERAREVLAAGEHAIIVLDEVFAALHFRLLALDDLLALLDDRPEGVELVLTGRWAPEEIIARSDYVTEMRERAHPYAAEGLVARDGIER